MKFNLILGFTHYSVKELRYARDLSEILQGIDWNDLVIFSTWLVQFLSPPGFICNTGWLLIISIQFEICNVFVDLNCLT